MAGRKVSNAVAIAVAVAVAVALVAMLVAAAAAQDCGVKDKDKVMRACMSYCAGGSKEHECCDPLRKANVECLCSNWSRLQSSPYYAPCANKIKSKCRINCQ